MRFIVVVEAMQFSRSVALTVKLIDFSGKA
jgi:hypothetical protein